MKSTPKKRNVHGQREKFVIGTQCNLYTTDLRLGFVLGVTQILAFLDTNNFMLVLQTQSFALGV